MEGGGTGGGACGGDEGLAGRRGAGGGEAGEAGEGREDGEGLHVDLEDCRFWKWVVLMWCIGRRWCC